MTEATIPLLITSDEADGPSIVELLTAQGIETQSSTRKNLDGSAVMAILVVASVAVKAAPAILRALTEFLTRNRVKRIEYAGIVVENPRPEDVDEIIRRLPPVGETQP